MDTATRAFVRRVLGSVPGLAALPLEAIVVSDLGGAANRSLFVDTPAERFVLRIAGPDPGGYVDRANEIEAVRLAERLGIGAELVHADAASGLLLTRRIEDAEAMTPRRFRAEPESLDRAGAILSRLHRSGAILPKSFDVFALLEDYERRLLRAGGAAPPWSPGLRSAIAAARSALRRSALPAVASHCDPIPQNFLAASGRLFLIDWEYAGMNDPAWDLAYLSLEGGLDADQRSRLLAAYGNPVVTSGRLDVFGMLAAALGSLWGLLQAAADRPALAAWTEARIAAAERWAGDPLFPAWIAALR